ncbi:response regulator transcription factor [Aliarcobacter vitoriensis]|uniref:Helix-turn-helix transcriptional regulator n=1 Tax=Aliarcobacter vitoriensis TaxID=2011099 RepID=A0A366MVZ4_9BACT|nr:LuxR C-terminal-related transcriptional regulator [Aliarcobacter vitoriensis]RBQ30023.1 helix-turn-helix transcriptional regulator [Aliarcobacter vitoriensis]
MKKLALFTSSEHILNRWKTNLSDYDCMVISSFDELLKIKDVLVVFSTCVKLKSEDIVIDNLLKNNNKVLVLDSSPKLENAQKWLSLGINGYGNSFMSNIYLNSAVESIFNDLIWIVPEVTMQLLKEFSKTAVNNDDTILKDLTKTEYQIAILLKNGYSNSEIADELRSSINTVKTHIKNIYFKLEVNDRVSFINLFTNKS